MEKLIGQYVEMLNDRHPQQNGANAGPPNGCPAFAPIKPAKINLSFLAGYSALLRAPTMSILLRVRLVARLTMIVNAKASTTAST